MNALQYLSKLYNSIFHKKPVILPSTITAAQPKSIVIKVNDIAIGAIQTLVIDETRSNGNLIFTVFRMRFDRLRLTEAFSRGFVHVNAQKLPLQIEMECSENKVLISNAWIESTDYVYQTEDWIICNKMTLIAEEIRSI